MRYAKARIEKDRAELAYRIYVTDSLRLRGEGKFRTDRYADLIKPPAPADNRPSDKVAKDILAKAGVEVISTNGSI